MKDFNPLFLNAITGVPQAIASKKILGELSIMDGITTKFDNEYISRRSLSASTF